MTTPITAQATIQRLRIQNYRVLRDVEFRNLTPLTVLLGPNGGLFRSRRSVSSGRPTEGAGQRVNLEILVEELSAECALGVLPRIVPGIDFEIHVFRGKTDLLKKLPPGGYHQGGLAKVAAAAEIAQHMDVDANLSRSFRVFRDGVRRLVSGGTSAAEK